MELKIVQNLSTEARHRICNCYDIHAIIILNDSGFSEDFIWYGKLFQTLGPKTLKLLHPKITWLCTDIFKFKIYFPRASLLVSLKLKRSLINSGLRLLRVLIDFGTQYS